MDAHPDRGGRALALPVTPAQIVAIGLVAAALGGSVWLARERPVAAEVPLLDDTSLTAAQLAKVEAALDRAGLTAYRTESGKVWVPRSKQSAYKRAVVDADAIPRPWGTRFHDALKEGGVWASPAARAESLRVARQDELALVLASMPGIERASVMVDEEPRSGFQQESLKTASVGIHGAVGMPLDAERARAVRVLVAASVAGLDPERVAVTDLATGRVFSGPLDPASSTIDAILARTSALESAIAGRVRQALESVPGVFVTVSIDAAPGTEGIPASAEPERRDAAANAPAEVLLPSRTAAAAIAATGALSVLHDHPVDVTVSVPESHLAATVSAARRLASVAGGEGAAVVDASVVDAETERLHGLASRALAALAPPGNIRVHVTRHPAAGDSSPSLAAAMVADPPSAVRAARSGDTVRQDEVEPRRSSGVSREGWLAITSALVGLLAGVMWWAGSRDRGAAGSDAVEAHDVGDRRMAA